MPIYEYQCSHCGQASGFLIRNASAHRKPLCPHCGSRGMARSISRFTASTSHRPGAVLPQDMGEPGGGSSGESEAGGEETPDPRALGRMMRDVAAQSGEPVEPEMNEVIRRLEAGEDPEAIESRMGGDLAGPAPGGDDTLYDG